MNRILLISICLLAAMLSTDILAQPSAKKYDFDLAYFLPTGDYSYNKEIPTPEDILGFQIGQQHADWGQVVNYMEALAKVSPRVKVNTVGRTYQHRPFIEVIISSKANIENIDNLRQKHLDLSIPEKISASEAEKMPVVVSLIYSIHGNEASGVNSTLPLAYFLAAAEGANIDNILDNVILVMTPGANPDGINRFASWVNSSRSITNVSDPNSREFTEPWPSSRTNHYWADCNRDLLMLQHPEGINSVETYFKWLPNLLVDIHEQGAVRPYYFSPGPSQRVHPFTSQLNQELTTKVSNHTAAELDKIGTAYYSKEGYDDYYYGKAAAFGDIHGSVCLLYEQGTSRGHLRRTPYGEWPFAWTIRNQARASYATLLAAANMHDELIDYQRNYYADKAKEASKENVKGYIFDTRGSRAIQHHFLENMRRQRINVHRLATDTETGGKKFRKDEAFVIPVEQKNYQMVKAVMEDFTEFTDSVFYDISAWTFPDAFNLNYAPVKSVAGILGDVVTDTSLTPGKVIGGKSDYGYVFNVNEFYMPKMVNELQNHGVKLRTASRPFTFSSGDIKEAMDYGAILIMTQNQPLDSDNLYKLLAELAEETGIDVYAAKSGLMADTDLGSPSFKPITQPKVAILTGRGVGIPDSGEAWFLLDYRYQMQPTLIESSVITAKKLSPYNVIILANGVPNSLTKAGAEAIKDWVAAGGTLIASGKANELLTSTGILPLKAKTAKSKTDSVASYKDFADKSSESAGQSIKGAILKCRLDKTHPLAWGLDQDEITILKNNTFVYEKDADPYSSPLRYASKPLKSGYLSKANEKRLKDTPAVFVKPYKTGNVIYFIDDMNFRSYWFGGSKLYTNAIFYRECM